MVEAAVATAAHHVELLQLVDEVYSVELVEDAAVLGVLDPVALRAALEISERMPAE